MLYLVNYSRLLILDNVAMFGWTDCSTMNKTHFQFNYSAANLLSNEEIQLLLRILASLNETNSTSCIKPHFRAVWPFFIVLYSLVGVCGAIGNVYMIWTIINETSCRRFINYLLFNLCASDLFKSIVVLPLSLIVLSIAHWRLGSWLCYASPLLQILPVVVTMFTYVLIAFERHFLVFRPSRSSWRGGGGGGTSPSSSRLIYAVLIAGVWICSICLILPLKTSVRYYDLELYFGQAVEGYGFCAITYDTNTKEINCALFTVLFVIPLAFITYLMTKTNQELNTRLRFEDQYPTGPTTAGGMAQLQVSSSTLMTNPRQHLIASSSQLLAAPPPSIGGGGNDHRRLSRPCSNPENINNSLIPIGTTGGNVGSRSGSRRGTSNSAVGAESRRSFLSFIDHERTQLTLLLNVNHCMCTMLGLFALCWTPLECVMLICYIMPESPETSTTVDVLFVIFTLMGLSSTVANPALLMYQKKSVQVVLSTGIRLLRRLSSSDSRRRRSRSEDDPDDI